MREAMATAEVGDDCFGEDPTVRRLEERVAELLGKERALFFPSGIMANQCGVMAQTRSGDEVLLEARAHLLHYEEGSLAVHGGLLVRTVPAAHGLLDGDELRAALRPPSPFHPPTTLLALENSHLDSGGRVMTPERTAELAGLARGSGLAVHLDGARLWNAAAALEVPPARLAESVDTVMTCLSKGLGAPVGSMLAGPAPVLERAWRIRRRLGGQMRQAGMLAAAGLHALEHHLPRLPEDHRRARMLGERLAGLPGVSVVPPETNILMLDVAETGRRVPELLAQLRERGVRMGPFGGSRIRAVLHHQVTDGDLEVAVSAFARILGREGLTSSAY
ncbi:MAG: low specificity L-threonine aldolase [Gemmatimonadales bacterium]|nr:MAG: low specificity L-threonine aldolase [Gemmatimonadales bacterium]